MLLTGFSLLLAGAALPALAGPDPRPSGASPMIGFGTAVAVLGEELFVGRPGSFAFFPLPAAQKGAVYVYRRASGGAWTEAGSVTPADAALGDGFGSVMAAHGDVLVAAAPTGQEGRGAVYVFERAGTGWREAGVLRAPDGAAGDAFGQALALQAGVVVVGAPGRDSSRGAVFAFRRDGAGWTAGELVGSGASPNDRFGAAVAFAGDRLVVGAPGPSPLGGPFGGGQAPRAGAAVVFRPGSPWTEEARLVPGDSALALGTAIAAAGSSVFVSAPLTGRATGAVYEFRRDGAGAWSVAGTVTAPAAGSMFGLAVGAAGDNLLVGAPFGGGNRGQVFAYRRQGQSFGPPQTLMVEATGMMIAFGSSVAVTGDLAVVGGPGADFFEGMGYVFERGSDGRWSERGTVFDRPTSLPAITGGERRCSGERIESFACDDVDILSFLPTSALGADRGIMLNDIWGWTDSTSGREFALVGRMDGTAFVEITDPVNPVYLGELPLHPGATPNMWRDIKVYRDHAFIVADGAGPHGMQVFDLRQLLSVGNPPGTFTETAHYDRIASAHNIVINEDAGFAYTVGNSAGGETCGGALHMIDIRDPRRPTFAGCFADPSTGNARTGYTHDAQCVVYRGPDTRYAGREVCFNASETAVGIADVTDKKNPKPIAVASYPNTAYAHQGWLSDDHRFFFLDDEGDELSGTTPRTRTMVWDVADLEEPVLVKEFLGTTAASDHNLYVRGNYMFQSNYVSGLRVIDISDPANPREVGFLDTVPFGENVPGFAGSWSNYPYFKSGTIIVSSMREGLFVVRHRPERPIP